MERTFVKVAAVQMDVKIGEPERNLAVMIDRYTIARNRGAELVIFPECALTGYCFDSVAEALPYVEEVTGPSVTAFQQHLSELGGAAVMGMLTPSPNGAFNTAVLFNGVGVIGTYRKIHLPGIGIDQFATHGDEPFRVYQVGELRVGLAICYDSAFPESSRLMAMEGADLIALPTNFPTGAENMTRFAINTRALENKVYFAAVNRVGEERGFRFIGETTVADPDGNTLCKGSSTDEEILYFDVVIEKARDKRVTRAPGKHAIHRMADRRPEFYAPLAAPHNLPRRKQG